MITIHISKGSFFDEKANEFIEVQEQDVQMEHSLYTISKWEEKWHKPYLTKSKAFEKSQEEAFDYMRCMCLDEDVNPLIFMCISQSEQDRLMNYIKDPHTATTVTKKDVHANNGEETTAETLYYAMFANQIPIECEHWHINKLLKLLEVFSAKMEKPKKMPKSHMVNRRRSISKARGYR